MLERAARRLAGGPFQDATRQPVRITRGAKECDLGAAVPGGRTFGKTPTELGPASFRDMDWIVCADHYRFDGEKSEPQRGDVFEWEDPQGQTRRYRALPRSGGDRVYEPADQLGLLLRVHTKLDETPRE